MTEIARYAGKAWREMSESEKQVFGCTENSDTKYKMVKVSTHSQVYKDRAAALKAAAPASTSKSKPKNPSATSTKLAVRLRCTTRNSSTQDLKNKNSNKNVGCC